MCRSRRPREAMQRDYSRTDRKAYRTRKSAKADVFDCTVVFYDGKRRHLQFATSVDTARSAGAIRRVVSTEPAAVQFRLALLVDERQQAASFVTGLWLRRNARLRINIDVV